MGWLLQQIQPTLVTTSLLVGYYSRYSLLLYLRAYWLALTADTAYSCNYEPIGWLLQQMQPTPVTMSSWVGYYSRYSFSCNYKPIGWLLQQIQPTPVTTSPLVGYYSIYSLLLLLRAHFLAITADTA
jgi:hypothetical protein